MNGLSQSLVGYYSYAATVILMVMGLYILIAYGNLIKKLIGLGIFQSSAFVLFILLSAGSGAQPPVIRDDVAAQIFYANPLPHVLILTAIVVSVATMALGLSLVIGICENRGTSEEEDIGPLYDEPRDDRTAD